MAQNRNPPSEMSSDFGAWIKRARTNKGLYVRQLADASGLSQSTITDLENMTRSTQGRSVELFIRLARGLNMDLGYVLHQAGYPIGASGVNLARLARVEEILQTFAAQEHVIRTGLAEAVNAMPPEAGVAAGRALAAFDLVTERLHKEEAL